MASFSELTVVGRKEGGRREERKKGRKKRKEREKKKKKKSKPLVPKVSFNGVNKTTCHHSK